MDDVRYGFYLRPSPAMCRAQAEIHGLLARQYNLHVAGKFMPHATIKGFFRSDAPVAEQVARLDAALAGMASFPVVNGGVVNYLKSALVLDVNLGLDGGPNPPLQALHDAALEALMPLVHPECRFTTGEWYGPRFHAHLTLAMADIPEPFFDEIAEFVRTLEPIGPQSFPAEWVQLFSFTSEDWDGVWGETLEWRLLHSWKLSESGRPPS